ncbi:MAG: aquaporin [Verrucomicrobiota bacterium]|jgi:aquaporin Z|nr:aquaporin [Verrucomicrobiota bacterium]
MDDVLQNPTVEYRNTGEVEAAKSTSRVQGTVLVEGSGIGGEIDLNRPTIVRQLVAEFIGVFALMFVVVSVAYLMGGLQIALPLSYGMAVAAMVATFATISGGQLNPAVTLGLLVGGRLSVMRAGLIIVIQMTAAVLACLMLKSVLGETEIVQMDGTEPPTPVQTAVPSIPLRTVGGQPDMTNKEPRVSNGKAMLVEGALAFLWVTAFYGALLRGRSKVAGGIAVGLVVAASVFAGMYLTGGALNPVRAFGPAMVSGVWTSQAVYWIGPMVGGALAGLICGWVLFRDDDDAMPDEEEPSLVNYAR